MIIKKFQGKTEEEATQLAKKELGASVVIMNVRTVKKKGLFAFFKKPVTEVTAALEDEPERTSYKPILPAATSKREAGSTGNDAAAKRSFDVIADDAPSLDKPAKADSVESLEEKLESIHMLIEKQMQKEAGEVDFENDTDEQMAFFKLIYNTLIDNEVDEKYANEIIDELDKIRKPGSGIDIFLANIYQKMILQFGQPASISPASEGAKLVFFIGPTGVGKTTTIAKIASRLNVDDKKKVALLTTDTYRIAAAEQLRTYANILDAPFRVIYTEDEVKTALDDFKDYDYILVDTAGHSHHNEAQKNSMKDFLHCVDGIIEKEVYLVVSATTKYRDLLSIADAYTEMTDYKLIFTKLDETTTLGNLFNLKKHTGAQMSYITCGQNVPDDIEQFSPQNTVKQLLGGR
ncbi:MAG: flagellar biosynthesis protein FlhF [Lachnospiraceae bacterium]|nr:flagellar biosynthesis protein FlhF [Lachnospiraceae bacterium]MBR5765910.1 flagellar biosynthesis protein FlhF [Lachnospiraceae bacterium]MBR6468815.1 flagellar biosynthesis protein FlhF [Lachnospiraceae bacterium]MBR6486719.1 flagellar biosynthesis protein FlhF [Lachnospiraceae bacterium]